MSRSHLRFQPGVARVKGRAKRRAEARRDRAQSKVIARLAYEGALASLLSAGRSMPLTDFEGGSAADDDLILEG